jgi:hypothetical protein
MCEFDIFLSKKATKCLLVSQESYNFAPEIKKNQRKDDESQPN